MVDKGFYEKSRENVFNKEKSFYEKSLDFIKKYYLFIILGILVLALFWILIFPEKDYVYDPYLDSDQINVSNQTFADNVTNVAIQVDSSESSQTSESEANMIIRDFVQDI